jgi:hypothetical protein
MELHIVPRLETVRGEHPQAGNSKIRSGQVAQNSKLEVSARQVHRSNLHADPTSPRSAITCIIHGFASRSLSHLS